MALGFLTPSVVGTIVSSYYLPNDQNGHNLDDWVDRMLKIAIFALLFIFVAYLNWRWLDPEEQATPSPLKPLQARRKTPPAAIDDSDDSDDLGYRKIDFLQNERFAEEMDCKCLNF